MRAGHRTAETSIAAYHAMGDALGRQQRTILQFMSSNAHRDYTRAEIAEGTGERLSSICGRTRELLDRYILSECPRRPYRITGVNAHPLRLAPAQMDLL